MSSATRLTPARALALSACALTLLATPIGAQIRVSTQTVPLYVTVTDSAKRLVPDYCGRFLRSTTTASCRRYNFDNQVSLNVSSGRKRENDPRADLVKQETKEF